MAVKKNVISKTESLLYEILYNTSKCTYVLSVYIKYLLVLCISCRTECIVVKNWADGSSCAYILVHTRSGCIDFGDVQHLEPSTHQIVF